MSGQAPSRAQQRGIGLRAVHVAEVLASPPVDTWFEVISENFLDDGSAALDRLQQVRRNHEISLHGVAMYLGSPEPLNRSYLAALKKLIRTIVPIQVSDHLCWGSVDGSYSHDLLPLPMTLDVARYVAEKIRIAQDMLEVPIAIENVSSYAAFAASQLTEWDFVMAVAEAADCQLLIDVNNIVVSAHNHGFCRRSYIDAIDPARVAQLHLAGFLDTQIDGQTFRLDTHSTAVSDETWQLYQYATQRFGCVPTLLEWDSEIPSLAELLAETSRAQTVQLAAENMVPIVGVPRTHRGQLQAQARATRAAKHAPPVTLQATTRTFFTALQPPLAGEGRSLAALPGDALVPSNPQRWAACTDAANAVLVDLTQLRAAASLEIYHRQYWFRLLDSLADDFPALHVVVGPTQAKQLCEAYLASVGARHFCLAELGRGFGDFLTTTASLADAELLGELAHLEFAMLQGRDSVINPAAVAWAAHAPEDTITLAPGTTVLRLRSNALAVYRDTLVGRRRTLTLRATDNVGVTVICAPTAQGPVCIGVPTREAELLHTLLVARTLVEFAEHYTRGAAMLAEPASAEFAHFVSRCFTRWTENRWLGVASEAQRVLGRGANASGAAVTASLNQGDGRHGN